MPRTTEAAATPLDVAAFLARPLDPLVFYDILPSDGWQVDASAAISPETFDTLLTRLSEVTLDDVAESDLDAVRVALLAGQGRDLPAPRLTQLADHASRLYARLLEGGKSRRSLRMKLQQLNFFLRDILDRGIDTDLDALGETPLDVPAPWDWLDLEQGSLLLTSGDPNVRWTWNGAPGSQSCGFPSQLDEIAPGSVSIGSIFSDGAYLFDAGTLTPVPHTRPLALLFRWQDALWAVDYDGRIFPLAQGPQAGIQAPLAQVDRVRRIGDQLYLSDWTRPGEIVVVRLDSLTAVTQPLPGVLLLNDICAGPRGFYVVCKQQGKVFAYDAAFAPRGTRLGFGRGHGRLFDPLSLRVSGDTLQVLNWITGSLIALKAF